jgi:hypothetical protein
MTIADGDGSSFRRRAAGAVRRSFAAALLALVPAAASAQTVLETAATLFAGSGVREGSEKDNVYSYKPTIADLVALTNDPQIAATLNGLAARGVPVTISSELSQPDHCLFDIKTNLDARGLFASTLTVRIDLENAKAATVRKRNDGQIEGTLLGEANLACRRFSITARGAGSDPGIPKCDNVSSTAPIERERWLSAAREMSGKYCGLGKIEPGTTATRTP